jgi:hypothetical protein
LQRKRRVYAWPPPDEIELLGLTRAVASLGGVHLLAYGDPTGLAGAALLLRALRRSELPLAALGVWSRGMGTDSPGLQRWLNAARGLIVVGGPESDVQRLGRADDLPRLVINESADEPLSARAFRLGERLALLADAVWVAAVGLPRAAWGVPAHALIERALARHSRDELARVNELLEAAGRGPHAAGTSLLAIEQLATTADPRVLLGSRAGHLLHANAQIVHAETARAGATRPIAASGGRLLVIEYVSPCRIEELVAARWRGLRPGTAIIVAGHHPTRGEVTLVARAAAPEALEPLGLYAPGLAAGGCAVLSAADWSRLRARLGIFAPAPALDEPVAMPASIASPLMN